ncbi:hypothetical protein F5Y04DRAFT_260599 [Hypomontagnella monticulosa]|nr:hypothetical protein F5Y04DRAFT_260599 [Hypomontagnella monticulosa]
MLTKFCPLCDVLVGLWMNPDDNLANPEYPLSWLEEVRAIRMREDLYDPFITGVGWLNSDEQVVAPIKYECHYRDCEPKQDLDDYFTIHKVGYPSAGATGTDYWCYVVHNACWELLRDRIDPDQVFPVNTLARHLLALFCNTPVDVNSEALAPGHNYGHASDLHSHGELYSGYFTRVNASDYPFIVGDVTEKFEPDEETLEDEVVSFYTRIAHLDTKLGNYSETDPFCLLPRELVILVLTHLPSEDVCKLRHASRYVADLSSPRLLDQRFWSSRFDPDFEMGFVFAGPSNPRPASAEPADWRTMYLKAKAAIKLELFPGLRNRRRLWHIFEYISDALYLRLENEFWMDHGRRDSVVPPPYQKTVFAEAVFIYHSYPLYTPLVLSGRLFEWQSISWPDSLDTTPKKLRISSVYLNGKTYISGFRLSSVHDAGTIVSNRAGFINPRKEHEINLEPQSSIQHLEIAMSTKGIIGMCFHIQGLQDSCVISVGDMELTDPVSGICRLTPGKNMQCVGFSIGIDACKVIAISLIERQKQVLADSIHDLESVSGQSEQTEIIWNPTIPEIRPVWQFPLPPFTQYFNLCLNIDFGGPNGRLLKLLTRVDIFMGKFPSVFLGMNFTYSNGCERFYGRDHFRNSFAELATTPAIHQCFSIDGPRGEFMTEIALSWSREADTIQMIKISTNLGRSKEFRLYGKESIGDDDMVRVLRVEPGMRFVAFFAKVQSPLGHFRDFSARCEVMEGDSQEEPLLEPSSDSHQISITPNSLTSAEDMLAYPRGFAFAAADLLDLRRIRVSVDDRANASSRGHISGLWLEYQDSRAPMILGQWVKELDILDIPVGDRITEIAVWHDFTNRHKRVKHGPVKKLKFGTVGGVTKEFMDPFVGDKICLHYRDNPYENLSGIIWGCSHEWDHVRVLYTPKPNSRGVQLLMDSASYSCPSWAVPQRVFMQEVHNDGRPNPIVAFEVAFKGAACEISGLTIVYEDGGLATLGARGRGGRRMALSSDENLAQVEIGGTRENQILFINFLTTSGRRLDFSMQTLEGIIKRVCQRSVYKLCHQSCHDPPETFAANARLPPKGAGPFIGFWALPRRHDGRLRYARFGPMYERITEGKDLEK